MKKKEWIVMAYITAFFLVASATLTWAQQPLIQAIGNGEVNWATQVIRATGSGAPNPQGDCRVED